MVPDNTPSKASLLKWWTQFTHAQKQKKWPEYNPRMCPGPPPSRPRPALTPPSCLCRPPPRLCQAAQGLAPPRECSDLDCQRRRRPLRLGLHPRRRRKVVRLPPPPPAPLTPPSGLHLKENGAARPCLYFPAHPPQPPRSRAHSVSTAPPSACATSRPHSRRPPACVSLPRPRPRPCSSPPQYGKSLDWKNEHYTTHDVASVFRRYLTQMPVSSVRVSARRPLSLP